MRRVEEERNPSSCWSKARPDEMIFVLLARDVEAPGAIRAWVRGRVAGGLNTVNDEQMRDALACAAIMERERSRDYVYSHELATIEGPSAARVSAAMIFERALYDLAVVVKTKRGDDALYLTLMSELSHFMKRLVNVVDEVAK